MNKVGRAKITDFGVPKIIKDLSGLLKPSNPTSLFTESTRWLAPELVGAISEGICPPLSTQSDVYAFGAVAMQVGLSIHPRSEGDM